MSFRILSIDGGGVRGVIPAAWLDSYEQKLGKPLYQSFELIGGTSTGGLIAICAALGIPMSEVVRFYETKAAAIFSRREFPTVSEGLMCSKYGRVAVEAVLLELFAGAKLSDAKVPLLVPTVDLSKRAAHFFSSDSVLHGGPRDEYMRDVARCTSAAETYFDPALGTFADGGTCANNPAMCLVAEALTMGAPLGEIELLSLGTGEAPEQPIHPLNYGITGWLPYLSAIFMDPMRSVVDFQCAWILGKRYRRVEWQLGSISPAMDDASAAHIEALKALANQVPV